MRHHDPDAIVIVNDRSQHLCDGVRVELVVVERKRSFNDIAVSGIVIERLMTGGLSKDHEIIWLGFFVEESYSLAPTILSRLAPVVSQIGLRVGDQNN